MNRIALGAAILALLLGALLLATFQPRAVDAAPDARLDAPEPFLMEAQQPLSLITATPEEGFALAITLSRRAVTETQQDRAVLHALRPGYAHDAEALIAVSHVVAVNFQTVAAANGYWRE